MNVNDTECQLIKNQTLTKIDLARHLMPRYDLCFEQVKTNEIRWPCLDNFMFKLLPFMSEIFVQDGMCRTLAYPRRQSSLRMISMFPRHIKWAEFQQLKLTNAAKIIKVMLSLEKTVTPKNYLVTH